ncbi:MAG: rhodanese-like domain-containing protein, partial [Gammaproteobacteria bacterium]|nr:rhodanese-like domain-containing protein [Gammaproteobacteria bacterium]
MIPAKAAFEMLDSNPSAVLIDVRSDMEYLMVGHPKG